MDLKKGIFKPVTAIKTTSKDKNFSQQHFITFSSYLCSRKALRKLFMNLEIVK